MLTQTSFQFLTPAMINDFPNDDKAITSIPFPGRLHTYFGNNTPLAATNLLELAIAPLVKPNTQYNMVLTYAPSTTPADIDPKNPATWPTVSFADPNIKAIIKAVNNNLVYAVPGNSYPSPAVALFVAVTLGAATTGLQGLYVTDVKQLDKGAIMPALLNVVD